MNKLESFEKEAIKGKKVPDFRPGDTVKVMIRIKEGEKERLQPFEGVVIRRRRSGIRSTFTVRKISYGVGVERIFPLYSPLVNSIEVIKRGHVRRAKLYYLRNLRGKAARVKDRPWFVVQKEDAKAAAELEAQAEREAQEAQEAQTEQEASAATDVKAETSPETPEASSEAVSAEAVQEQTTTDESRKPEGEKEEKDES